MASIKKRELAAYIILYDKGPEINLGTAIDLIASRLCTTRRTARNIIKRLRKLNILSISKTSDAIVIRVKDPVDFIRDVTRGYIITRSSRCKMADEDGRTW